MQHKIKINAKIKEAFATIQEEFQKQIGKEVHSIETIKLKMTPHNPQIQLQAKNLAATTEIGVGNDISLCCHNTANGMVCGPC